MDLAPMVSQLATIGDTVRHARKMAVVNADLDDHFMLDTPWLNLVFS